MCSTARLGHPIDHKHIEQACRRDEVSRADGLDGRLSGSTAHKAPSLGRQAQRAVPLTVWHPGAASNERQRTNRYAETHSDER